MTTRRLALMVPPALFSGALAACAPGAPALPPAPRLDGYAYLTPLRLNVAEVEVVEATPGPQNRADPPAPLVPAVEVARMGRDRLVAAGTASRARFVVETATLARQGNRLTVLLRALVEVLQDNRRVAFAAAEARRDEAGGAANAEGIVTRAMADLNVEFELQVRRNLREWLLGSAPAPVAPERPGTVRREDLPREVPPREDRAREDLPPE